MSGFLDYSTEIDYPIFLQQCTNPATNELLRNVINRHHSYKKFVHSPTRRINWLVYETSTSKLLGALGISSCVLAIKCRDDYIGWKKDARIKNSNKVANNYRFCLIPNATEIKNVASMALKLMCHEGKRLWKERYGDDLVAIETYVEPSEKNGIYRAGACYKASNWIYVGQTSGTSISKSPLQLWQKEDSLRGRLARQNPQAALDKYGAYLGAGAKAGYKITKSTPKLVFLKPLLKDWRKKLVN